MKVWMLASGEYSDYTVHGLFETKEQAEDLAEYLGMANNSYPGVEITEAHVFSEESPPVKYIACSGQAYKGDDGEWVIVTIFERKDWGAAVPRVSCRKERSIWLSPRASRPGFIANGEKSAVLKALQDRVARAKAEEAGLV